MPLGTVKRWNIQKGFGFVSPDGGGDDVFVHQSVISMDGFRCLAEGAPVSYEVATEDTDGRSRATVVASPDGSKLKGLWGDEEHSRGTVSRWRADKGFGFVSPDDGGPDVFVHQTAIQALGFRSLVVGDVVEFTAAPDGPGGKPRAKKVTAEGGRPVRHPRPPTAADMVPTVPFYPPPFTTTVDYMDYPHPVGLGGGLAFYGSPPPSPGPGTTVIFNHHHSMVPPVPLPSAAVGPAGIVGFQGTPAGIY